MGIFSKKKQMNATEVINRKEKIIKKAVSEFNIALGESPFETIKKLGVLEYLNVPDLDYYKGMTYFIAGKEYVPRAIKYLKAVSKESVYYFNAIVYLVYIYKSVGKYDELKEVLFNNKEYFLPSVDFRYRLECLKRALIDGEIIDNYFDDFPEIKFTGNQQEEEYIYEICRSLSQTLLVCGECINKCCEYVIESQIEISQIENDPNVSCYIETYQKLVGILRLDSKLTFIQFGDDIESLAELALVDRDWPDKIAILYKTDYKQVIAKTISKLCNPSLYSSLNQYELVENLMEQLIRISPSYLIGCVNEFFEILTEATENGSVSVWQYLGVVYGELLQSEFDDYSLKNRIEAMYDFEKMETVVSDVIRRKQMSRKGFKAFVYAEHIFEQMKINYYGGANASGLSLLYFKVLEIEYNEKFIKGFVNSIDVEELEHICRDNFYFNKKNGDKRLLFDRWEKDINSIKRIKNKECLSMEIGVIRTMLAHIVNYDDSCSIMLRDCAYKNLSHLGVEALSNGRMIDVIGSDKVQKYRNPGAHTGFVPYSVAIECKQYVERSITEMEKWFI